MGPIFAVLGGPNGAGKTTASRHLMGLVDVYLNPDQIAFELAGAQVGATNQSWAAIQIQAGKQTLERLERATSLGQSVCVESTLAGHTHQRRAAVAKSLGYQTQCYFVALRTPDLALERVAMRVLHGGHDVPEEDVRRRWGAGLRAFFGPWQALADEWVLLDNSERSGPKVVARSDRGRTTILDDSLWQFYSQAGGLK